MNPKTTMEFGEPQISVIIFLPTNFPVLGANEDARSSIRLRIGIDGRRLPSANRGALRGLVVSLALSAGLPLHAIS